MSGTATETGRIHFDVIFKFLGIVVVSCLLFLFVRLTTILLYGVYVLFGMLATQLLLSLLRPKYRLSMVFQWFSMEHLYESCELIIVCSIAIIQTGFVWIWNHDQKKSGFNNIKQVMSPIGTAFFDFCNDLKMIFWPIILIGEKLDEKRMGTSVVIYFTIPSALLTYVIFVFDQILFSNVKICGIGFLITILIMIIISVSFYIYCLTDNIPKNTYYNEDFPDIWYIWIGTSCIFQILGPCFFTIK